MVEVVFAVVFFGTVAAAAVERLDAVVFPFFLLLLCWFLLFSDAAVAATV